MVYNKLRKPACTYTIYLLSHHTAFHLFIYKKRVALTTLAVSLAGCTGWETFETSFFVFEIHKLFPCGNPIKTMQPAYLCAGKQAAFHPTNSI